MCEYEKDMVRIRDNWRDQSPSLDGVIMESLPNEVNFSIPCAGSTSALSPHACSYTIRAAEKVLNYMVLEPRRPQVLRSFDNHFVYCLCTF